MRNESFACLHCSQDVDIHPTGSARNHCPHCLYSLHVDDTQPGDRLALCHGLMRPIRMDHRKGKGDVIVQQCEKCRKEMVNKVAPDDEVLRFVRKKNKSEKFP